MSRIERGVHLLLVRIWAEPFCGPQPQTSHLKEEPAALRVLPSLRREGGE